MRCGRPPRCPPPPVRSWPPPRGAGPRPVRDVYGVDATLLQPARCLDDLPDGVTARQVDLDRHSEAGTQPLRELRDGLCVNLRPACSTTATRRCVPLPSILKSRSALESALTWAGVVPQQPPTSPSLGEL